MRKVVRTIQQENLIVLALCYSVWGVGRLDSGNPAASFWVSRVAPAALETITVCTESYGLPQNVPRVAHLVLVTGTAGCVALGKSLNVSELPISPL